MVAGFQAMVAQVTGKSAPGAVALMELTNLTPDPSRFVAAEAVARLELQRTTAIAEFRDHRISRKLHEAIKQGFISPGQRTSATALCQSCAASFDAYCTGVPRFGYLVKRMDERRFTDKTELFESDAEACLRAQLGLKPGVFRE